jgi:hypothetical protein
VTSDEAAKVVIEVMNYAAYRETDSSLYDSDKNRLFGSNHYKSGQLIARPSPWAGAVEKKMVTLLIWANILSASPDFRGTCPFRDRK